MFWKSYLEQLREYCDKEGVEFSILPDRKSTPTNRWYVEHACRWGTTRDYGDTIEDAAKHAYNGILKDRKTQEWLYGRHIPKPSTPHEDALRTYCKSRGYFVFKESYGPSSVSPEVTWYLKAVDEKGLHITYVWENPIRTGEQAFSALLSAIKETEQTEAKKKLEEFCKQEGLRFVSMGPESVGPESVWVGGFGLSGHVFASYQKAITRLEEMKNNKEEKWEDKDRSELEKFCTEEGLRCDEVRLINQSIMITRKENFTLNDNLWFHGKTLQDAMEIALKMLEQQKKDGITFWSTGPYERKVRELCERKGWTLRLGIVINQKEQWVHIDELVGYQIGSHKGKNEEGFKEVWDKIEKLKELLS